VKERGTNKIALVVPFLVCPVVTEEIQARLRTKPVCTKDREISSARDREEGEAKAGKTYGSDSGNVERDELSDLV
jgi:hypothetical protein